MYVLFAHIIRDLARIMRVSWAENFFYDRVERQF